MADMPVLIVLAGGASSRMWPLREKSLLRFGTEPLLISQLRRFQTLGFNEAVVVGNPDNLSDIAALVGQIRSMKVDVVVQPEPRGMGDALLQAAPLTCWSASAWPISTAPRRMPFMQPCSTAPIPPP